MSNTSDYVPLYLYDLNVSFPSEPAVKPILNANYFWIYDGASSDHGPYPTSYPTKYEVWVRWYDIVQTGNIYRKISSNVFEKIGENLFSFVQGLSYTNPSTGGGPYYSIPESQQYWFKYTKVSQNSKWYTTVNIDPKITYNLNGYGTNSAYNYISVKNAAGGEPVTPDLNIVYCCNITPEFLVDPNLTQSTFTATLDIFIPPQQPFQPGTYTLTIPDLPTPFVVSTVLTTLSSTITFTDTLNPAVFPNENKIYYPTITCSVSGIIVNISNNVSVTIPETVISPALVAAPNTTETYTLTYFAGDIYQFPVGLYNITFTTQTLSNLPKAEVLTKTVITTEVSNTLIVPDTTLTEVSIYDVTGYYNNGLPPTDPAYREALFLINNNVEVNCFLKGTKITCLDESTNEDRQIEIESLTEGVLVKTYKHGYVPLKYVVYKEMFNNPNISSKDKLYKLKKEVYPELTEDLIITGGHSILVDNMNVKQAISTMRFWEEYEMIEDKYKLLTICNERAETFLRKGVCELYDIVLENENADLNYGIYANGILTESMSENFFKNFSKMQVFSREQ